MDTTPAGSSRATPVPFRQKLAYGFGGLVDGTVLHPLNIFLLFYVTAVCGLSGSLAGIAIAIGLVVDAVADPLIGSLSDRWHSRFGRRIPFMVIGLPIAALTFFLIFSLPRGFGQPFLFFWLCLLSIGLRVSAALFFLPHQALSAEITDDYGERSTLMALRWGMFMVGGLVGALLGFGVFFAGADGLTHYENYPSFGLTLSAIALFGGMIALWAAIGTRHREHPPGEKATSVFHVFAELREVFSSRSFRLLFMGTMLFFVGFGANSVLGLHANTFFWQLSPSDTKIVTLSLFVGLLLGAPLGGPLLARVEKRTVLVGGISVLVVAQATPVALRFFGLFPLEDTPLVVVLTAFTVLNGLSMVLAGIAGTSALADAADEHELLYGTRREGLYFSGLAFANKASAALGTLIAGLVLDLIDFPSELAKHGGLTLQLPDHAINILGLAYGPGAALLSVVAVFTFAQYGIDREKHLSIIRSLRLRHACVEEATQTATYKPGRSFDDTLLFKNDSI